jgi:predicted lipoprotein with Yx(FWY)xxD motif
MMQRFAALGAAAIFAVAGDCATMSMPDGVRATNGMLTDGAGMTLYFWIKDHKPGETSGDGFRGVWHVARQ